MSTADIVVVIVLAVIALLALGGSAAVRRRSVATRGTLTDSIARANAALATARAEDQGWDPALLEAAARAAWGAGDPITALSLVVVVDKPGTEHDEAVYRVTGASGTTRDITLARHGDEWHARAPLSR